MDRLLSFGSTGPDVKEVQAVLNQRPPSALAPLAVDGIFGPKTLARVKEFQRNKGLQVDGLVGPQTWRALRAVGPVPPYDDPGPPCGTGDPGNKALGLLVQQMFVAAYAGQNATAKAFATGSAWPRSQPRGVQRVGFAARAPALTFGSPIQGLLAHFRPLTTTQIATATGVFGSSLDLSAVLLVDLIGVKNRPFTVVVPASSFPAWLAPLMPVESYLIMAGTFTPSTFYLIHELTHVWQSQHHSDPFAYITNSLANQGLSVAANQVEAKKDPTLKADKRWPMEFPISPYAFVRRKAFGDYAAEQIAQQAGRGISAIVTHLKSVAAWAVDSDNVTSLNVLRGEDRRISRVEQ
jgi:peptidoglycan hydrolase-like protein with peptidoglycan-binding domain